MGGWLLGNHTLLLLRAAGRERVSTRVLTQSPVRGTSWPNDLACYEMRYDLFHLSPRRSRSTAISFDLPMNVHSAEIQYLI